MKKTYDKTKKTKRIATDSSAKSLSKKILYAQSHSCFAGTCLKYRLSPDYF